MLTLEPLGNPARFLGMNEELKRAYLKQAREADQKARSIDDKATADMWARIAESYRVLADEQDAQSLSWS